MILAWHEATPAAASKDKDTEKLAKQVREKADKFITWLK